MSPDDLKSRREALGISQACFNEHIGAGRSNLSRMERGERVISDEMAARLDSVLARLEREKASRLAIVRRVMQRYDMMALRQAENAKEMARRAQMGAIEQHQH